MKVLFYIFISIFLASCIPNKKVTLLQNDDLHENYQTETPMRSYDIFKSTYKLNDGDIVKIDINSLTDEQFDFFKSDVVAAGGNNQIALMGDVIDQDGHVKYPVIGDIKISGLTILEAEKYIAGLASQYVSDPVVKIRLLNFRVTMLGEINAPGTFTTVNDRMTFTEALGYAGGFSEYADIDNIKLIRQTEGQQEVIYLNPLDENFVATPYLYLYPNDLIIVPPLKQRPFRQYFASNLGLFVSSLSVIFLILNLTK